MDSASENKIRPRLIRSMTPAHMLAMMHRKPIALNSTSLSMYSATPISVYRSAPTVHLSTAICEKREGWGVGGGG